MALIVSNIAVTGGAGYICIDERASGGKLREADIYVCTHCQAVIFVSQWKLDGGFCGLCSKPICGPCADRMQTKGCEPFIKQIEQAVEDNYRRKQNARILGV